jgi:septal ring factor EnvC (AmiA/AmiB activator)
VIEEKEQEIAALQRDVSDRDDRVEQLRRAVTGLTVDLDEARDTIALHERRAREMREAIDAAAGRERETVPPDEGPWVGQVEP